VAPRNCPPRPAHWPRSTKPEVPFVPL